jgi:hypothetical protein
VGRKGTDGVRYHILDGKGEPLIFESAAAAHAFISRFAAARARKRKPSGAPAHPAAYNRCFPYKRALLNVHLFDRDTSRMAVDQVVQLQMLRPEAELAALATAIGR